MDNAKIADVLDAAADLIENKGWTQGVCARDEAGRSVGFDEGASCFCALGAIFAAQDRVFGHDLRCDDYFGQFLGGEGWGYVPRFNDDPERTQSEVVGKLREAATKARNSS